MLYLVGLGLGDLSDITLKGDKIIKHATKVFLESYTSIMGVSIENMIQHYDREFFPADREMVEQNSSEILNTAKEEDIAFLVIGDPLSATTHSDLILRAIENNIPYRIVHNASIINAVGCCGLQLYRFGEIVSLVTWTETWQPDSYFSKIVDNYVRGLHTLCLLDIKIKEQSVENLMKNRKVYEPPHFMTASDGAKQLLMMINNKIPSNDSSKTLSETSVCVALARVGFESQLIKAGTLRQISECDMGPPVHSLVICGNLHPLESEFLKQFSIDESDLKT